MVGLALGGTLLAGSYATVMAHNLGVENGLRPVLTEATRDNLSKRMSPGAKLVFGYGHNDLVAVPASYDMKGREELMPVDQFRIANGMHESVPAEFHPHMRPLAFQAQPVIPIVPAGSTDPAASTTQTIPSAASTTPSAGSGSTTGAALSAGCSYDLEKVRLNLSTEAPWLAPSVYEITGKNGSIFTPVSTNQDLADVKGAFNLDDALNGVEIRQAGLIASPFADTKYKVSSNQAFQSTLALGQELKLHIPEGAKLKMDARYSSEKVRAVGEDGIVTYDELKGLGDTTRFVWLVDGSSSYLNVAVLQPGACATPHGTATGILPFLKQYASAAVSVAAGAAADAVSNVTTAATAAQPPAYTAAEPDAWRRSSLEKRAVDGEMPLRSTAPQYNIGDKVSAEGISGTVIGNVGSGYALTDAGWVKIGPSRLERAMGAAFDQGFRSYESAQPNVGERFVDWDNAIGSYKP